MKNTYTKYSNACFVLSMRSSSFFFKQKTAYEIGVRLVGSEMCIRDSDNTTKQHEMAGSVNELLNKVLDAAMVANDESRGMEHEIAYQRDITDSAKNVLDTYTDKQ